MSDKKKIDGKIQVFLQEIFIYDQDSNFNINRDHFSNLGGKIVRAEEIRSLICSFKKSENKILIVINSGVFV